MRVDNERRALLDRIERRLPPRSIREVPMFGAIAIMLDDAMLVAVRRDHSLLVRVDPEDDANLLRRDALSLAESPDGCLAVRFGGR